MHSPEGQADRRSEVVGTPGHEIYLRIFILGNLEGSLATSVAIVLPPGSDEWTQVPGIREGPETVMEVPLVRGCAMVCLER